MERRPQPPEKPEYVIPCRVVALDDTDEAVCCMVTDRYEVPRVGFPAWVLRRKGLGVGSRFNWIVRDPESVQLADIDKDVRQTDELTPAEMAELERLYEEMKRGLEEDGGVWPEYTGDGE